MGMTERTIKTNGVEVAMTTAGDPTDPAIVLMHGAGQSSAAWDDEFVARLATGGRFVIRFDARDTGRSTSYPVGAPEYGLPDLVADTVGLLDELGIDRAGIVGMSQGSAVAQLLAIDHPDRVSSLTVIASTPGGPGHDNPDLPTFSDRILASFQDEAPQPDWDDRTAVVEYLVDAERPYAATSRPFDEEGVRAAAERAVDRAGRTIAAQVTNPFLISAGPAWRQRLGEVTAPTLVLHGTEDPFFPYGHGVALAKEIPGARLVALEAAGHEVPPKHTWDVVVPALLEQTAGDRS
ncbi:alpha/beta fold hydrolase [Pseudonocardia sp. TRM90224]|uniref:alpha/beta fold hydrolase n=1 Tax=Pseudonocardia sp. TRM90224 TaxID=2812678 RepID=UPI001E4A62BB|nr:alpha/beta hydrolase [Pseudonocardia sp. TRM90224]